MSDFFFVSVCNEFMSTPAQTNKTSLSTCFHTQSPCWWKRETGSNASLMTFVQVHERTHSFANKIFDEGQRQQLLVFCRHVEEVNNFSGNQRESNSSHGFTRPLCLQIWDVSVTVHFYKLFRNYKGRIRHMPGKKWSSLITEKIIEFNSLAFYQFRSRTTKAAGWAR